ncbi:hypothetical protein vseg_003396 [Gypsophila vaccaria]
MIDTDQSTSSTIVTPSTEIPVIFYDGEREIDLGKVQIIPTMTFKLLQSTLSNKIGISPNHITIYFDRTNNINNIHTHNHHRRRHPVTSKFDFHAVLTAGAAGSGSFFWVVLKRGRRNRRRRKNDAENSQQFVLLRRGNDNNININNNNNNNNNNNVNVSEWEYYEYVNKLRMIDQIEREKERYLMSLNLNSNVYNELSSYHHNNYNINYDYDYDYDYDYELSKSNYSDEYCYSDEIASCSSASTSERVVCEVCCNYGGGGEAVPFHWCKNDVVLVTNRARPAVGPIGPPLKTGLPG